MTGMKSILQSRFVRNVATLMTGSLVAQATTVLITPVLTRLFTPEAFGVLSLYVSIIGLLIVITTGKYEFALMIPESPGDAWNLAGVSMMMTVGVSLLAGVIVVFRGRQLASFLGSPSIAEYLTFIPLSLLLVGFFNIFNLWLNRNQHYRQMAYSRVSQSLSRSGTNVSAGVMQYGAGGLVFGEIVGQAVGLLVLAVKVVKNAGSGLRDLDFAEMKRLAKQYRDFPTFDAFSALLDTFARNAPVFFLAKYYGVGVAGFYGLSMRVLGMPMNLLGRSFAQVYMQKIAEMCHDRAPIAPIIFKAAGRLLMLITGPIIVLLLFAPFLFALFFGEQWREAGEFTQILSIAIGLRFIISPLMNVIPITGHVRLGSALKLTGFLTTVSVLWIASSYDVKTVLIAYVCHETIKYAIYFAFIVRSGKNVAGIE